MAVLVAPSGIKLKYVVRLDFAECTNNVAEYEGLLLGLRKALLLGAMGHIDKTYKAQHLELVKYKAQHKFPKSTEQRS